MSKKRSLPQAPIDYTNPSDEDIARGLKQYGVSPYLTPARPESAIEYGTDVSQYGTGLIGEKGGEGFITAPEEQFQDIAAQNQGAGSMLLRGTGRLLGGAAMKTLEGFSLLGSGVLGGIYDATGLDQAIGGKEMTWDDYVDNPVNNTLFKAEDWMKSKMQIYKPSDWNSKSFLEQVSSGAWWADEGSDAAAFALSTLLPAGLLGDAGIGAKMMGTVGEGAGMIDEAGQVLNSGTKVAKALNGGAKALNKVSQALNFGEVGMLNLPKTAGTIDNLVTNALMTTSEALFEARDTGQQMKQEVVKKWNETYPNQKVSDFEELPDQVKQTEKEKMSGNQRDTFLANLAALSFTNKFETALLNKFGSQTAKAGLKALEVSDELLTPAARLTKKGISGFFENTGLKSALKEAATGAFMEGILEENIQSAIQNVSQHYSGNGKDNWFLDALDYTGDVVKGSFDNLSDQEAWKSIGSGMVIGALSGVIGGFKEHRQEVKDANHVAGRLNEATNNFLNVGNALYERIPVIDEQGNPTGATKIKLDQEGNPLYNNEALNRFMANQAMVSSLESIADLYQSTGNEEIASYVKNEAFSKWAQAHLESGLGEEMYAKLKKLGTMKDTDLLQSNIPITTVQGEKVSSQAIANQYIAKAKELEADYRQISKTIPAEQSGRIDNAYQTKSRLRELGKLKDALNLKLGDYQNKIRSGNDTVDLINRKVTQLEASKAQSEFFVNASGENAQAYLSSLDRLEKEITQLKADNKDMLQDQGHDVTPGIEPIPYQTAGMFKSDFQDYTKTNDKLAAIEGGSAELMDHYNGVIDYKNGEEFYNNYLNQGVAGHNLKSELEKAVTEQQAVVDRQEEDQWREFQDNLKQGDFLETPTEQGYVAKDADGNLTFNNRIITPAVLRALQPTKVSEADVALRKQEALDNTRRNQMQARVTGNLQDISVLNDAIRRGEDGLLNNQIELEKLINKSNGKANSTQNQIAKQIEAVKGTIDEIQSGLDVANQRKSNLEQETTNYLQMLESGDVVGVAEVESELAEVNSQIEELNHQISLMEKLKDEGNKFLSFLEDLWKKAFPNKRRQLEKGRQEYTDVKEEIQLSKQQLKQLDENIANTSTILTQLNNRSTVLQNEITQYQLAARAFSPVINTKTEEGVQNKANPVTEDQEGITYNSARNPDVSGAFTFRTTGFHGNDKTGLNPKESQRRWFKWAERTPLSELKNLKLRVVTINDETYGTGKINDLFRDEPMEYKTEHDLKVVVVDSRGNAIDYMGGPVHTNLLLPKDNVSDYKYGDGSSMFINKTGMSDAAIKEKNDTYKKFTQSLKDAKEPVYLEITGKSNGVKARGERTSIREVFGTEDINLQVVTSETITTADGTSISARPGTVITIVDGRVTPLLTRKLSSEEGSKVLDLLKDYSKLRENKKANAKELKDGLSQLKSIVFMGDTADPATSMGFVTGENNFKFGNALISIKELQSGEFDPQIRAFLENKYHQVSNDWLKSKASYEDVFGKKWNSYKDYLIGERDNPLDAPLTSDLVPVTDDINKPSFYSTYVTFGTDIKNSPKAETKSTKTNVSIPVSTVNEEIQNRDEQVVPVKKSIFKKKQASPVVETKSTNQVTVITEDTLLEEPSYEPTFEPPTGTVQKFADVIKGKPVTEVKAPEAELTDDDIEAMIEASFTPKKKEEVVMGVVPVDPSDLFLDATRISENYVKEDTGKAQAWFKQNIGENVPFHLVNGLVNQRAFGMFSKHGEVLISDLAVEGTVYHESFHAVTQLALGKDERKALYDNYRKTRNVDLSDRDVEEELAEEFRTYMLSQGEYKIPEANFFKRLWNAIKKVIGIPQDKIEELYKNISTGKFKGLTAKELDGGNIYSSILSDYSVSFAKELMEGMTTYFMRNLFKNGFSVKDIVKFQEDTLSKDSADRIAGTYNNILSNIAFMWSDEKLAGMDKDTAQEFKDSRNFVTANWKGIVQEHNTYMQRFGINMSFEDTIYSSVTEEDRNKDTLGIINNFEFSTRDGMPNSVKLLFAALPSLDKDGKVATNAIGLHGISDYTANQRLLQNKLSNVSDFKEQVSIIKDLMKVRPEFKYLLQYLGVQDDNETPSTAGSDIFDLQMAFRQQFDKAKYSPQIIIYDEGTIKTVDADDDRIVNAISTEWQNNLKAKLSTANIPSIQTNDLGQLVYNADYLVNKYFKPSTVKKGRLVLKDAGKESLLSFYKDLGIEFSDKDNIDYGKLADKSYFIMNSIQSHPEELNLFAKPHNLRGDLASLLEEEVKSRDDLSDNQHINPEGKTVYSISLNNYLSQTVNVLNRVIPDHLKWNEKDRIGNPFVRNSQWGKKFAAGNKMKLVMLEGAGIAEAGTDAKMADDLTRGDTGSVQFQKVLDGVYPLLQPGDKKLAYGFSFGEEISPKMKYEEMVSQLKGYLSDELLSSWMLNVEGIGADVKNYKSLGKDLRSFKGAITGYEQLIKKKVSRQTILNHIENFVNSDEVTKQVEKWFDNKVDKNIEELKNYQTIKESKLGVFTLLGISEETAEKYAGKKNNLSTQEMKDLVKFFTYGSLHGNIEQTKLFTGDTAFYEFTSKKVDFFKRVSGLIGTGKTAAIGEQINNWFNTNFKQQYIDRDGKIVDGKVSDGKINTVVFNDVKIAAENYNGLLSTMDSLGYDKEYSRGLMKAYSESADEADAQGYITMPEYREFLKRTGDWKDSHEVAYQKMLKGDRLTKEDIYRFPPLKPQYFGNQQYGELYVPTFYKFSVMPLIPQVISDIKANGLKDLMDQMHEQQIGIATFTSGNKVGVVNTHDFYDENGNVKQQTYTPQVVGYEGMKIQLDISPEVKDKVTFGTQFRKLVLMNLKGNSLTIDGKKVDGNELIKKYSGLIDKLIQIDTENLTKKLGIEKKGDKYKINNVKYLKETLVEESVRRGVASNLIEGIEQVFDADKPYMDLLVTRNKMENILMSMVNNNLIKQKMFGDMKVQGASTGFEQTARKQSSVNDQAWASNLEALKFYDFKDGKTQAMEVYLPHYFKEYFDKNIDINDLPEELKNFVGFRIPTQGLNSIEVIKIKGFLPQEAGNIIITPSEIVTKAGSDYDIDKLTVFFPNYKVNYDMKQMRNDFARYVVGTGGEVSGEELTNLKSIIDKGKEEDSDDILLGTLLGEKDRNVYQQFKEFQKEMKQDYVSGVDYIKYEEGTNDKKAIQNEIIKMASDMVSAPENFAGLMTPNSTDIIKGAANEVRKLKGLDQKEAATIDNLTDWSYNLDVRSKYLLGKAGIGHTALQNVHHVLSQIADLTVSNPDVKIELDHNLKDGKIFLGGIYDANNKTDSKSYKTILDVISEFANGFLDVAKDPFLKDINANVETINTYMYLIRAGVPVRQSVLFMTQPIITDYLEALEKNDSLFLKNVEQQKSKKQLRTEVEAKYKSTAKIGDYKAAISEANLAKYLKGDVDNAVQLRILSDYFAYKEQSDKLGDLVNATSQDTRGTGASMTEAQLVQNKYNEVVKEKYFDNIQEFMNQTFLGSFKKSVDLSLSLYQDLFITERPEVKSFFNQLTMQLPKVMKQDTRVKLLNMMKNDFIQYIFQNSASSYKDQKGKTVEGGKLGYRTREFFAGTDSIPYKVAEIKRDKTNPLHDNLLINELYVITGNSKESTNVTTEGTNNLKLFNKRMPVDDSNRLTEAWKEIFDTDKTFGDTLLKFSILQSGLNSSPISFMNFAPNDEYIRVAKQVMEAWSDSPMTADFLEMYYQNNYKSNDLVPNVKRVEVRNGIAKISDIRYTNSPYIKTWIKTTANKGFFRLLKNTNTQVDNNTIFEEIDKRGNGYQFKEFTTGIGTMLVDNKAGYNPRVQEKTKDDYKVSYTPPFDTKDVPLEEVNKCGI